MEGLKWCRKMMIDRILYFTKVDKGGSIMVLDVETVESDILKTLKNTQKYELIQEDPRSRIRSEINEMINDMTSNSIFSVTDRLYLTGQTEKGGYSHDPSFCVREPYLYPLYKIHKLSKTDIDNKVIPQNRMVTSSVGGPTYRIGKFLEEFLKPVAEKYCEGELVKDTPDFLFKTDILNDNKELGYSDMNLFAMDIVALYPSMKIDVALEAVNVAHNEVTSYSEPQIGAIIKLLSYTLRNSVVCYRGEWYKSCEGALTGNPEIPPVANIMVKYLLDEKILPGANILPLNRMLHRLRFLDDVWGVWQGSAGLFQDFLKEVNSIGSNYGIAFTGNCDKSVEFLDVTTSIMEGKWSTTMYVKPTDSTRYLNRRSYHSKHTFSGIPYSQFRRAAVICSDLDDRKTCVSRMEEKFLNSGYKRQDLLDAKEKALSLNRAELLKPKEKSGSDNQKVLAFVVNQHPGLRKELSKFFKENRDKVQAMLGDVRVVISEKRHQNIASVLFQKSGFSKNRLPVLVSQKCNSSRCFTRPTMELGKREAVNGQTIRLDFRHTCASEEIIYLAKCKVCDDSESKSNFYFGQSVNSLMKRCNGHRSSFKLSKKDESALSMHVYDKHPEQFGDKLSNFNFGIVEQVPPAKLNRVEDFYIFISKADTCALNRYKVTN